MSGGYVKPRRAVQGQWVEPTVAVGSSEVIKRANPIMGGFKRVGVLTSGESLAYKVGKSTGSIGFKTALFSSGSIRNAISSAGSLFRNTSTFLASAGLVASAAPEPGSAGVLALSVAGGLAALGGVGVYSKGKRFTGSVRLFDQSREDGARLGAQTLKSATPGEVKNFLEGFNRSIDPREAKVKDPEKALMHPMTQAGYAAGEAAKARESGLEVAGMRLGVEDSVAAATRAAGQRFPQLGAGLLGGSLFSSATRVGRKGSGGAPGGRVKADPESIRLIPSALERFSESVEAAKTQLRSSLASAQQTWQDRRAQQLGEQVEEMLAGIEIGQESDDIKGRCIRLASILDDYLSS